MSKRFDFKQFNLALVHSLVLFDPYVGPCQVLPLQARVDLDAMVMKRYSIFPKAQGCWNLTIRLLSVINRTLVGMSYSSAEKQYSTVPADWSKVSLR